MTTRTDTTFTYTWLLLSLDLICDFIVGAAFGRRTRCGVFLAVENARGFGFADRLRLAHRAEEARDLGRILDEVIDIIGHRQLGEDITGEEFAFGLNRSEEHTSELQSLMRISYAVFCLKKKNKMTKQHSRTNYKNNMKIQKDIRKTTNKK